MAQLTLRNIPDETVRALRIRAAQNGRSAEAEHRLILRQVLDAEAEPPKLTEEEFWSVADAMRAKAGKQRHDSAKLLREMRAAR